MNTKNTNFIAEKLPKDVYRFLRDNHKCIGCGKCCHCSPIAITGKDIRVMACKLGMNVKEFKQKYTKQYPGVKGFSHFKQENPCAFLDKNNKCKIYDARPDTCRQYPLMKGIRIPKECVTLLELLQELIGPDGQVSNISVMQAQQRRLIKAALAKEKEKHEV
jgi:Fe-S-cluster containining protein